MKILGINVLYYPTISIPNIDWLRSVIMYADKIATIVPNELLDDIELNDTTKILMEEKIYDPLSPEDFFYNQYYEKNEFENELMKILIKQSRSRNRQYNQHKTQYSTLIHNTKFTYRINEFMRDNKLMLDNGGNWGLVEEDIADIYMNILAKHMAYAYNYVPSTEKKSTERQTFGIWGKKIGYHVGFMELSNCLPIPVKSTSIDDMLKLKKRRHNELGKFQQKLLDYQGELANAESQEELNHYKNVISSEIQIGIEEIKEYYGESRIETILISLRSLFELQNPTLLSSGLLGTSVASYAVTHKVVDTLITSGVHIGILSIASRVALRKKIKDNPFSYLFYADRNYGLKWRH